MAGPQDCIQPWHTTISYCVVTTKIKRTFGPIFPEFIDAEQPPLALMLEETAHAAVSTAKPTTQHQNLQVPTPLTTITSYMFSLTCKKG